ncbi:MAG TPA: glycogen synthase GlgA [Acetobacteraceae bacterium]|nr:glycogen synthase GlgA [Acetobacteraceae bacterium]
MSAAPAGHRCECARQGTPRVLFVTSELAGLVKAGGLGDVAAGLPRALRQRGIDVRILIPAYPAVLGACRQMRIVGDLPGRAGLPPCRIGRFRTAEGLIVYIVIAAGLYERGGSPYCRPDGTDWPDNDLRFARLSLAAAEIARGSGIGWRPDVLHLNDWPGGLAPAYLRWDATPVPAILTLHNMAHQGVFPADRRHALGIPEHAFAIDGVEFHGKVSFLKAGLYYADHVCAVSPTYAREITTEALGGGLHGLTRDRAGRGRLSGIVNGIDESWNPARDPHLPFHFDAENLRGKARLAELVRTALCLAPSQGPLLGVVSRLVPQKGLDILAEAADDIVREGGQIIILGLGEPATEQMLNRLARQRRDHICVLVGFNEAMARRIIGGGDFCLIPSRFEPCGLTQMQAQRYGTLPIAHATGGLVDTIEDGVTGFLFYQFSTEALLVACRRAFDVFGDAAKLVAMRWAAMSRRFGWEAPAAGYELLYARIAGGPALARTPARGPRLQVISRGG